MRALGRFIYRHAIPILFVLGLLAFGLTYHRQENLIAENRRITDQVARQADQLARQAVESKKANCESRVDSRNVLANLLLGIVDDFIPVGRPARLELERRINEALRVAPDGCDA